VAIIFQFLLKYLLLIMRAHMSKKYKTIQVNISQEKHKKLIVVG
jgi:hypothetical protein